MLHDQLPALCGYVLLLFALPVFEATGQQNDVDEIIVTASRQMLPASTIASSVTIFTAEDIQNRGIQQLSQLLREVPGFAVSQSGATGTFTQIRVRGAEANHTLVLIDGMEVNDPASGFGFDFGHLSASNIARVEILRGPQGVLWGSDAIGAVINIVTKAGQGPASFSLANSYGTQETAQTITSFNYGQHYFDVNFNMDILSTDGSNIAPTGNEDDGLLRRTYDIKFRARPIQGLSLGVSARYNNAKVETDPTPYPNLALTDATDHRTDVEQTYLKADLQYTAFDEIWRQYFSVESSNINNDFETPSSTSFNDGEHLKYAYANYITVNSKAIIPAQHHLALLFEYQDEKATGSFLGGGEIVGSVTKSYVLEYQLGLSEQFSFSAGVRMENHDLFNDVDTYHLSGIYSLPHTTTKLKISHGTGIKHPTLSELYGNFPNFTGNPNLSPERAKGWGIGIEQQLWQSSKLSVSYFNNLITDQITGFANTARNAPGENRIDGLELSINSNVLRGFNISGTYTYTDARNTEDQALIRRAQHIASINCNYSLSKKINLSLGIIYNGKQIDNAFDIPGGGNRRVTLGSYKTVNLAGQYQISEIFSVYVKIDNLFDEDYEEIYAYQAPGINGQLGIRMMLDDIFKNR